LTNDEEDADIILQDQDNEPTHSNSYSLKFVIDSFFWENLQEKEKYIIKQHNTNSNSINSDSILEGIKYVNSTSRSSKRFAFN